MSSPEPVAAPRPLSRVHVAALDRVRGLAIALVLVHNISSIETRATLAQKLWVGFVEIGWVGVQLFFVLSGFLITGILADDRERPDALKSFYLRRVLRIFPLYYGFLIVYYGVLAPIFPELRAPFGRVIWYWLYLSNWTDVSAGHWLPGLGHFWSLAVEEQFYLLWPWLVIGLSPRALVRTCVVVAVAGLLTRVGLVLAHVDTGCVYSWTITRADALVLGALMALAVRSAPGRDLLRRGIRPAALALCAVMLGLIAVTHGVNRVNPLMQTVGYSVVAGLSAILVVAAGTARPPPGGPGAAGRFLAFLGKHSYAIYVLHMPLKRVVLHYWGGPLYDALEHRPILTDVALVLALSAVSIVLAQITWVVLERPFLSLKNRLAPR